MVLKKELIKLRRKYFMTGNDNPKCTLCNEDAYWKVKYVGSLICDKCKLTMDKKTELILIRPLPEKK